MVGTAVCRLLIPHRPRLLVVASRQGNKARRTVEQLKAELPDASTRLVPVWGDVFLRADWRREDGITRAAILLDPEKRRRLTADILDPLDEDIIRSSLLTQIVTGTAPGLDGSLAQIVVDCMNTATALSYQDVYASAQRLADLAAANSSKVDWPREVGGLLTSLYVPRLVRHVQLLHEALQRAGSEAYVKVGTSGTGGMGLNIPYTHGEEKPSHLLLSKAAIAGAQTLLTFLMARTPSGPTIVKEIKPTALIGWRKIDYGPVGRGGQEIMLFDCRPDQAVFVDDDANLVAEGEFGESTGERLEAVYIDTGENGQFSAAEFTSITALGQMRLVTPEEVAESVVRELVGGNTGRDVIAALDSSVTGPTYRSGYLRQAALNRLRQLESEHGEAVAFEILGPPRLSKLLYEAYLLKQVCRTTPVVLGTTAEALAEKLEQKVRADADARRRIISIGIPILLPDGRKFLRGPIMKSRDSYHGWVDLTAANMSRWQERLKTIREMVRAELSGETSSRHDREFAASREWAWDENSFDIGEIVAWIFTYEDQGKRGKD
jgi:hypothetical protein